MNYSGNGLFVYVINEVFEFENLLLEIRGGLSLKNRKQIEIEALSENAIILLLELSCN